MTKKIEIAESDFPSLIEFYLGKWEKLSKEIAGVESTLIQLGVNPTQKVESIQTELSIPVYTERILKTDEPKDTEYPISAKWIEKCRYLLRRMGSATATEIINAVLEAEPNRMGNKKQLTPTISGVLADEVKKENASITRKENSKGNFEYTLK